MHCGAFEYRMPEKAAKDILATRKTKDDKKRSNQQYLCDYVNNSSGLLYKCVKVVVY